MESNRDQNKNVLMELKSKKKTTLSIILIGAGLAGLIDIIIFHLVLQSHHTLSSKIPPNVIESLKINIFGDGLFIALSTIIIVVGSILFFREYYSLNNKKQTYLFSSARLFMGLILIGFGLFNIIEGIINHHILGIHHVIESPNPLVWDLLFLLVGGLLFVGIGIIIVMRKV